MGSADWPRGRFGISKLFTAHAEKLMACRSNVLKATEVVMINQYLALITVVNLEMKKQ
jgi:hypothetical protein